MTKYREYFLKMMDDNKPLFEHFTKIHHYYTLNPQKYQLAYNVEGAKVVEVIHEYERRLCGHSEKGVYSKFSSKLAEKFWEEIRKHYPKIDFIGVKRG